MKYILLILLSLNVFSDTYTAPKFYDEDDERPVTLEEMKKELNKLSYVTNSIASDSIVDGSIEPADLSGRVKSYFQGTNITYKYDNKFYNGDFRVWTYGTSITAATLFPNNDDSYVVDGCNLISDGNDIVDVSRETSVIPSCGLYACKFDVQTANKQFGIVKFIEQKDCYDCIGSTVSVQFKARTGTGAISNIRAAVLSWSSTADTVTSDVVGTWAGAGTNPTWATNWTAENTPANLALTTSYQTFEIENVSIDTASTTNIALVIWVDDTTITAGDLLYLADIKLERNTKCTDYIARDIDTETNLCKRYIEPFGGDAASNSLCLAIALTTSAFNGIIQCYEKRIVPSMTLSAVGDWAVIDNTGTRETVTALALLAAYSSKKTAYLDGTIGTTDLTANTTTIMLPTLAAVDAAKLYLRAEM